MKDKIVVAGGYGQVGKIICRDLAERYPGKVYAAGRNFEKAEEFSLETGGKVLPMQLDVKKQQWEEALFQDVHLLVMCLDQQNTGFIEACLRHKVHYIDISASHEFLTKVKEMNDKIPRIESTAVLSVGLDPGLTNMLVKHSTSQFDKIFSSEIYLMLGLGEKHGKAAIQWTVDNMNTEYFIMEEGRKRRVRSFEDGKKTIFPGGLGKRSAYRFNFTDQHVLPQTLQIPSVSTRLCFDSAAVTKILAFLKKAGVLSLLKKPVMKRAVTSMFERIHMGTEIYAAKVISQGERKGEKVQCQCSVRGENEARITGKVAAFAARQLYSLSYSPGIYHMEELYQWEELFESIKDELHFEEESGHPLAY